MSNTEAIRIEGLALHPAGTCDGCGHEAVELAQWSEEIGEACETMQWCRACLADDADDPSLEWVIGEPVDAACLCPDDCNCRAAWRTTYCGCKGH